MRCADGCGCGVDDTGGWLVRRRDGRAGGEGAARARLRLVVFREERVLGVQFDRALCALGVREARAVRVGMGS